MANKKQWQNLDLGETKTIMYHSKGFDGTYSKMYFLFNLNQSVKVKNYAHL